MHVPSSTWSSLIKRVMFDLVYLFTLLSPPCIEDIFKHNILKANTLINILCIVFEIIEMSEGVDKVTKIRKHLE